MKKLIKKFLNWVKSSDDLQADYYPSALEVVPPPPSKKRIEISQMHSFELKRKKEIQFLEEDSRLIILKSHIYEDLGKIVILKIQKDFEAFRKTIIRWEEKDLHIREFPENKELKNNIDFLIKSWKDQLCNNMGIDASIIPHMADEDYRKELAKVFRVRGFMQANNIKLGQRFASGPQDGNDEAFKKLKHLFDIARKTLRE